MVESRCGILCDECEYKEKTGCKDVLILRSRFGVKSVL